MSSNGAGPAEDGFEYQGTFYRWHFSDMGKDLMLIDRFAGMPVVEFFETVEDDFDRGRAPVLLTLIATSIRNGHPDWSVERIVRTVMNLNLSEVTFIAADEEEEPMLPPAESGSTGPPDAAASRSPSTASSSSSTPPESSSSETSYATPV